MNKIKLLNFLAPITILGISAMFTIVTANCAGKDTKIDISSIITTNDLGEIESETEPAVQTRIVELNSGAENLTWSQLEVTSFSPTSAQIVARKNSTLYKGNVDIVFFVPQVIYNVNGTNWPGYISGSVSYSLDEHNFTYTITYSSSNSNYIANDLVIPEVVWNNNQSYSVIGINTNAFGGNTNLTGSLTLANTITTIGNNAFSNCRNLSGKLFLPNDLTSLGSTAFMYCGFTDELVLPNNLNFTTIKYDTFEYCSGFTSIIIPSNITRLDTFAFAHCSNITSINIPNSVSYIDAYAFGYMPNCTSIVCDYAIEPGYVSYFFMGNGSSTGTLQNTNSAYSSEQLLTFFKTKGLPAGWTAIQ